MSTSTPKAATDSTLHLLHGRHALITGASRGIGAAIARALARAGAAVTLAGRSRDALDALAAELYARGHAVHVVSMDVTDENAVHGGCAGAEAALGSIDILVNNAGVAESAPLARMDREHWDRMLAVNLTGPFLCCRAVLPGMLDRSFGRIVNIASTAGLRGYAYVAAYSAAKHGVIGLTRSLALETARRGITVNAICPGYTQTSMLERTISNIQAKTGRTAEEARAELVRGNPQGRLIQPEEVAATVLWLCAPGSESVTGQSIALAGGEVM
ncbi:MAG TPA: SDR family NAD(P)-dependent oxidoreductase [Haliangium sp.]|nr:SDR family NAD(P)-dependent oxidoreductase [Haliangium sp.]